MSAIDVTTLPKIAVRETLGGSVLEVDAETGAARLRYVPGERLNNPVGTVFGGYLAAMIDDAAGLAAWFGGGRRPFATAQMSVNFLRVAKAGEALVAEATVISAGTRQAFVEIRIARESDGAWVATGSVVQSFAGPSASPNGPKA